MQVTCGADWYTDAGNTRQYAVCFSDADLILYGYKPEDLEEMTFTEKLKTLNNLADAMVIAYIAKEGGISKEAAKQRLAELSNA